MASDPSVGPAATAFSSMPLMATRTLSIVTPSRPPARLARIQGERSTWLAKSYRSRRSLDRRGAGKETGVAEASLGSTLYAGSVPGVPAGLSRQRGPGWNFIDLATLGDNRRRYYL